jgi:hypothetical protein
MTAPVLQRTYTVVPNNRISIQSFPTLVTQGGRWMRILATIALANGMTCKGSSNGVTAAMDGTNRWVSDAAASVQGATTSTANSWLTWTDGNGADTCLSFVGATGDVVRVSFSPSGSFVAAGTATFTPVSSSSDEQVLLTGTSVITTSLVNDRIVHVWVDSEAKIFRTCTHSANLVTNGTWGVELVNANRNTLPFTPAVWGFAFSPNNLSLNVSQFFSAYNGGAGSQVGGLARINGTTVQIFCGGEAYNGGIYLNWSGPTKPQLQKAIGDAFWPIYIGTNTANRQGPIGSLFDWWTGKNNGDQSCGDVVFPGGQWVQFASASSGPLWPWDGASQMQVA